MGYFSTLSYSYKVLKTLANAFADKPLEKIDHMMWDADRPTSPNTICGMMILDEKISRKKLMEVLDNRLLKFNRFQQKIKMKKGVPHWSDDYHFELKNHVHFYNLKETDDYSFLQKKISKLLSHPLDHEKPLWDIHIYQNYKGGSAIIFRLHHAIADGVSLIQVLFSLTGENAKDSLEVQYTDFSIDLKELPYIKGVHQFIKGSNKLIDNVKYLKENPKVITQNIVQGWEATKEMASIFTDKDITGSIYKGEFSEEKNVAWSKPMDLLLIKKLGKQYKATVNDVLLALMTGAIRSHLVHNHQKVEEGIRVVIPVNIRAKEKKIELHNEISFISLELPVHVEDFTERLQIINEKTTLLKNSAEPYVLNKAMEFLSDKLSDNMKDRFIDFISTKIAAAITNVPGPRKSVYLAGSKVKDIYCWIPHTAPLGVGLSMISYNNKITVAMVIDKNMADDPDVLIDSFENELKLAKKFLS
jgi:diacylglycerol O-acyltransferase / wax synthase